jgi:hypothetical protein
MMNKIGIADDATATYAVLLVAGIGILLTIYLYMQILNEQVAVTEELDTTLLLEMEQELIE